MSWEPRGASGAFDGDLDVLADLYIKQHVDLRQFNPRVRDDVVRVLRRRVAEGERARAAIARIEGWEEG